MTHLASHTEVCHILNPSCILAQSLVLPITITVLYSVQYITTITYNLSRVVPLMRQLTPKNRKNHEIFKGVELKIVLFYMLRPLLNCFWPDFCLR